MRLPSDPATLRDLAARSGRMSVQDAFVVISARLELAKREITTLRGVSVTPVDVVDLPAEASSILDEAEATVDAAATQPQADEPPTPPAAERDPLAGLDEVLDGTTPPARERDPLA